MDNSTKNNTSSNSVYKTENFEIKDADKALKQLKSGNERFVNDDALGSIEYGVAHANAPLIVVMGHESCGAVTAAYDKYTKGTPVEGNIEDLVEEIEPSINKDKTLDDAIRKNVTNVANEIRSCN